MSNHVITLMVFLPLLGAIVQAILPGAVESADAHGRGTTRWVALFASLGASACAVFLLLGMQTQTAELQSAETLPWVGSYAISYEMGLDGLNALLVLLIACVFPLLIACEWRQSSGVKGMHGLFLVLQSSLAGAVCAQDLFLQFFFWALASLPFYFLIGIWGGQAREKAAIQYAVISSIGNSLIFAALILIYYSVDPHTFLLRDLAGGKMAGRTFELLGHSLPVPSVAFALIGLGFAMRAPIWPLHGWFTLVAREAPASVFTVLCAAVVPVAVGLFLRLAYSLFPEVLITAGPAIAVVGLVNLVFSILLALAQRDLRTLLAFMCMAELGFVLVGVGSLDSAGVVGAVYHLWVLGLGLGGFGLLTGLFTERMGHTVFAPQDGEAQAFGGIARRAPRVAVVCGMVLASLLGFPGFGGFVGHSLMIIGSFDAYPFTVVIAAVALLAATYCLFTMYRRLFMGPPLDEKGGKGLSFDDLSARERAYLFPLVAALVWTGIYPKPLLELVRPTVLSLLRTVGKAP